MDIRTGNIDHCLCITSGSFFSRKSSLAYCGFLYIRAGHRGSLHKMMKFKKLLTDKDIVCRRPHIYG